LKLKPCPEFGQAILPYYENKFESGFIILQPFTKYRNQDRKLFEDEEWPKSSNIIKLLQPLSWQYIINEFSFKSIEELDYALLSWIHAIFSKDEKLAQKIELIRSENIFEPSNGVFDEFLFQIFIEILSEEGYKSVRIADEFFDTVQELTIKNAKNQDDFLFPRNIYSPDEKILFTVHWDSFFVIFLGSKELIEKYTTKHKLEGFWCNQETDVFWSKQIANQIL